MNRPSDFAADNRPRKFRCAAVRLRNKFQFLSPRVESQFSPILSCVIGKRCTFRGNDVFLERKRIEIYVYIYRNDRYRFLRSERIVIANLDLISLPREKETRAKNSCRLSLARPSVHVHNGTAYRSQPRAILKRSHVNNREREIAIRGLSMFTFVEFFFEKKRESNSLVWIEVYLLDEIFD